MAPARRVLCLLLCMTFRCEKQHRASDLIQVQMTRTCSSPHCSRETLVDLIMLDLMGSLNEMELIMWEWICTKLMKMNITKVTALQTLVKNSSEILKCSLIPMMVVIMTSQLLRFKKVQSTKSATLISRAS